jgi:hypothetical protein
VQKCWKATSPRSISSTRLVELWREQFTGRDPLRERRNHQDRLLQGRRHPVGEHERSLRQHRRDPDARGQGQREHVKQALAKRKESETLGDALLNLGFITRKELTWARRVQVVGVIRSIGAWTEGSFTIVADYLPKRDEGTMFPLPQVVVELIVTDQDRARFERALDGGSRGVQTSSRRSTTSSAGSASTKTPRRSPSEIDGVKSATEVATASRRDTFNVYKLLNALATLGILTQSRQNLKRRFAVFARRLRGGGRCRCGRHVWNGGSRPDDADRCAGADAARSSSTRMTRPVPTVEAAVAPW